MMKKSTFGAALAFLAAATGALTAAWLYLRRREKELDEYEELLFSDDEGDADDEEEVVYEELDADDAPAGEPAEEPAEEAPAEEQPEA